MIGLIEYDNHFIAEKFNDIFKYDEKMCFIPDKEIKSFFNTFDLNENISFLSKLFRTCCTIE